ncbi:hypothetical protein HN670_03285 [bacterium]|nr:hypothetical protein [bacterium]
MKIKQNKYSLIILLTCVVFFFVYSFTTLSVWWPQFLATGHLIFNWPDANANYFFSQLFASQGQFSILEVFNHVTDNLLHTRSINVLDGWLVPMTFLWPIIIFGSIFKVFGGGLILFLTPLLASATVFILYKLFVHIFADQKIAFITALLLLPLGPWLFFANVVMLPTVLFIFLLSSGLLALVVSIKHNSNLTFLLSSLLTALALVVRPTEFIWVAAMLSALYYFNYKKIAHTKIIIFLAILFIFAFLTLWLNKLVYGGWFNFGYLNLQANSFTSELNNQENNIWAWLKLFILPFGWNTKGFILNTWEYLIKILWPYWLLIIATSWLFFKKRKTNKIWRQYFIVSKIVGILLLIYYASWDLIDPLVKQYNTISISYVRYFLPLYILAMPVVALAIQFLFSFKNKKQALIIKTGVVIILGIFSLHLAFLSPHDGLKQNKITLLSYYQQFDKVQKIVPAGSVMLTERSDKLFFPYYKVIVPQGDLPLWPRLEKLAQATDIFYYSSLSEDRIITTQLEAAEYNLDIIKLAGINEDFNLYKIQLINQ